MKISATDISVSFELRGHITTRDMVASNAANVGGKIGSIKGKHIISALDKVNLELHDGDRVALIGHNGSGKSTLLKVLAGVIRPQNGIVQCDCSVAGLFSIGVGFRPEASGYRNIVLKGLMAGRSIDEIRSAIPEIAAFSELGPFLEMPLRTYSQGMAMRLAFAIATAFPHDALLIDEWIGAGDASFSEKATARMTNLVESANILVVASHSPQLLRLVTNKAVWMESGSIREIGDVETILTKYEIDAKARRSAKVANRHTIHFSITQTAPPTSPRGGYSGVLMWDTAGNGLASTSVYVVSADGSEKLCFVGAGTGGTGVIKNWLSPGQIFRLRDPDRGDLLASAEFLPTKVELPT